MILIIWGFRVLYRVIGTGTFHCPRCGGDREYQLRSGRRWFTLFYLPVIPLKQLGEHVRCATCKTSYRQEILAVPTTAQMQAALPAAMRAAAAVMVSAGDPDHGAARQRAIEATSGAGAAGYGNDTLTADLASAAAFDPPWSALGPVETAAGQLAPAAREWFLAEVVRIGLADGPLSQRERDAASQIAARLGMTPAQTLGVVTLTEQAAASG